jgi:hypothetical protein
MAKLKLKNKAGKLVDLPEKIVRRILGDVGFTGDLLIKTTGRVLKEAKKLATSGVVTTAKLEKAIVRGISNTNKIAVNSATKFTKRVLK